MLWDEVQSLVCLLLNFFDAALVGSDEGKAFLLRLIVAIHDKVISSAGMDGNILEECHDKPRKFL
jgi:hypothetical protein